MAKIWITLPYDPDGIREAETIDEPTDQFFAIKTARGTIESWQNYPEGGQWHRSREKAIIAAKEFRRQWLQKTTAEAARIAALPPIC